LWVTILAFPQNEAGNGIPRDSAKPRNPSTRLSRATMTTTIQAATPDPVIGTRNRNAPVTITLSANGSAIRPKSVVSFQRRAICPPRPGGGGGGGGAAPPSRWSRPRRTHAPRRRARERTCPRRSHHHRATQPGRSRELLRRSAPRARLRFFPRRRPRAPCR